MRAEGHATRTRAEGAADFTSPRQSALRPISRTITTSLGGGVRTASSPWPHPEKAPKIANEAASQGGCPKSARLLLAARGGLRPACWPPAWASPVGSWRRAAANYNRRGGRSGAMPGQLWGRSPQRLGARTLVSCRCLAGALSAALAAALVALQPSAPAGAVGPGHFAGAGVEPGAASERS